MSPIEYITIAGGFAFAAAIQPGPLQAFLLSRVASVGWKRTLPAAFAPLISDGPIAAFMLIVLHQVAHGFERFLKGAGGIVLLYFAVKTIHEWRRLRSESDTENLESAKTLMQAVAVNAVNPGPYLGWSLILGPLVLEAWAEQPLYAVVCVASFYTVMVSTMLAFILVLGTTSFLGPRGRHGLMVLSAIALAVLGVYSLCHALGDCGLQLPQF